MNQQVLNKEAVKAATKIALKRHEEAAVEIQKVGELEVWF